MFFQALSLMATAATALTKLRPTAHVEKICKPLIVPALMCSQPQNLKDPLFVLGGVAHLLGDIELMREHGQLYRGAAWFGLGHLAFIIRHLKAGHRPANITAHLVALLCGALIVKDPKLIGYGCILATYSTLASPLGGALFIASDSMIALNRTRRNKWLDFGIISTYGLAQWVMFRAEASEYIPTAGQKR
ncbi:MAG: lysoplasmalogenase family protein [Corynebacterium sp.]|uniref:lysoplasmalogenase family protein n=1 Tax=Corynebacterium sp. TaxID=1720 RepID=UPI0026DCAFF0|nr:lysoplasmalogenase family protein [Corynebacterium sp.]MDO4760607.1 lysoplasmalogenase family protein [Corynebacterium sp.]